MAIDGTDTQEATRLAAEFNNSFGDVVRASVGPESELGKNDAALLGSFGPAGSGMVSSSLNQKPTHKAKGGGVSGPVLDRLTEVHKPEQREPTKSTGESAHKSKSKEGRRAEDNDPKPMKNEREDGSSSGDSDVPRPKKKKSKKKSKFSKRKDQSDSGSSPNTSSDSESSSSDSSSSQDSDDAENAELVYDITEFQSADLPDLPDKWDKGFRKLRSYVPLTLFQTTLLEKYHDEEAESRTKDKSELSKGSLKAQEKLLTYGDFIEMSDLEERYAREIYGLHTYADYVVQHKRIISDLKKTYNCWMIGLRYHLKVRTVIFRRRKLIKSKVKGKTVVKDKVKIPNGLQPAVERQARHDADCAGDLQFIDNPYAFGGSKFGYSFSTGRPVITAKTTAGAGKSGDSQFANANRGKRGGIPKKPYPRRNSYTFNRYNRYGGDVAQG